MNFSNLTVIITHYNTPEWLLDRAVKSILKRGLSFIIVNDYSDSQYTHFLDKYGERVLNVDRRMGTAGAMYAGMFAAKTPYVMRFDSDDILIGDPGDYTGVDVTMQAHEYNIPRDSRELADRPDAYIGGAIFRVNTTIKLFAEVENFLHDDIELMYKIFEAKLKTYVSSKKWYLYTSDREDSKTKKATLIEKKEQQDKLRSRYLQ
jgi:glycosyltransferase involved in cell wall biosynthesis